jgi:hypothetical protein
MPRPVRSVHQQIRQSYPTKNGDRIVFEPLNMLNEAVVNVAEPPNNPNIVAAIEPFLASGIPLGV